MNMEQLLIELVKQVPALAVLGFIVVKFLDFIIGMLGRFRETVMEIQKENMEA